MVDPSTVRAAILLDGRKENFHVEEENKIYR
jgi:hypothetical protein